MEAGKQGSRLVWDGELAGFGVRVSAGGVRSYVVQYRLAGRTHRMTLGRDSILTAEAARERARAALAAVAEGRDPKAERERRASAADRPRARAGPRLRLTKATVEAIEPERGRECLAWDAALAGFGVRVSPRGVRTYFIQYRAAGRSRRMALGRHGVLTAEQARKRAQSALGAVAEGRDPAEEKREAVRAREAARRAEHEQERERAERTVSAVAEAWLRAMEARAAKGKVRERTVAEYRRQAEKDLAPRLGDRPLEEVRAADVRALHDALAEKPVLANRVVALLSQLCGWALREGYVTGANPTHGVEPYAEKRREAHLTRADLAAFGAALRELEAEGKVSPRIGALVRLVAFTGCRPGEVKGLAWSDVDLDRRVLRVRGGKTGDRSVWLNGPALAVLRGLSPVKGSPWVFPSRREKAQPVREFRKPWAALLNKAELAHGPPYMLRHTFASESEAAGNSLLVTAALLGHAAGRIGGMTGGYIHHVPQDVRTASEKVGKRIAAAMDGKGGEVRSLGWTRKG